ncbi:N-acetylmuramoyl-L-alanine amidase (plasmid) [Priestia aryabhattai]
MKKLIALSTMVVSLLITSPAFAATSKSGTTMSTNAIGSNTQVQTTSDANHRKKYTFITPEGEDLIARLVRAEATGQPFQGKVEVAVAVLNRMDSCLFPNTIWGVLYQPNQFTPVKNGQIKLPADAESIRAVNEALYIDRANGTHSLFFYNPKKSTSTFFASRQTTVAIGDHVFKK